MLDTDLDAREDDLVGEAPHKGGKNKTTPPRSFSAYDYNGPALAYWDDVWIWGTIHAGWPNKVDPDKALITINSARRENGVPEFFPTDFIARFGHQPPASAFVHSRLIASKKAEQDREMAEQEKLKLR